MKFNCHGCGVEKDTNVLEVYPYPEDGIIDDKPIQSLFDIDCQPWEEIPEEDQKWRKVTICHACLHRLNPDMWISSQSWDDFEPDTPFKDLPLLIQGENTENERSNI